MQSSGGAPRVSQWVLPVAEVRRWFDQAGAGALLVYAKGEWLLQSETARYVRELALAGLAHPLQPRAPEGGFHYTIKKLAAQPAAAARSARLDEGDESLDIILRTFRREANMGLRASTNSQLALKAGLATAAQAAWRVRNLVQLRRIRVEVIVGGKESGWRIVTILPSGKSTLAPQSWERAKAQVRQEVIGDQGKGVAAK